MRIFFGSAMAIGRVVAFFQYLHDVLRGRSSSMTMPKEPLLANEPGVQRVDEIPDLDSVPFRPEHIEAENF